MSSSETDPPDLLDLPLHEVPLAFVDFEMTGLEPTADRIVEVCVERVSCGRLQDRMETLVRPSDGRFGSAAVHGLSEAALLGAPTFDNISDRFREVVHSAVWVGHGIAWDLQFAKEEFARIGKTFDVPAAIDTLPLVRRVFGFPSSRLGAVAAELAIAHGTLHRAAADVAVVRAVFERVRAALGAETARELLQVRVSEGRAAEWVLRRAAEAFRQAKPVLVRYRPSGRSATEFEFVVTEVKTALDPPRILGYLLPGRGRRELRADRILDIRPFDESRDNQR